jgi:signal transduction histidine kinase
VPEALSEAIFQPFFTTKGVLKAVSRAPGDAGARTSAQVQGSGLGLFLAHSVAVAMGGDLRLEKAAAPDLGGARFKILLPRVVNR